jgi:PAS domain S-box-containing protein
MLEASKTSDSTRSVLLELEAYHKNGTIIWIEISVSVIRDNDLNPVRLLVVSRDITHRRLSEEQLQVLSFAVEQSPAMILITNTEGIIEYANQKFIELTGYTKDELLGKKPGIIKSGKMPNSLYKEMWNTIKANKIWYGEIINKTKDGKLYWVNIAISPIIDKEGNVFHFVGLAEDITSRKRTEDELIIAKERAEQSDRLKTAFLRGMSHEIRTPMNAIIGFSELMVSEFNDKAKLEAFSKIIHNQCLDLLSIIDGIIDIAKIESGILSICLTNCNLMDLFKELKIFFEDYKKRLDKLSIEFELNINSYPPDIIIKIDVIKLRQIFINLINNAFKFSEEGKIEAGCKSDENHELIFFVSDTGIGIPADKQKIIFDRFLKLNQDTNKYQIGSGLGLSIVKELIDLMGGKIWLESEPDKGSTFYFSIPYQIVKN